MRCLPVQPSHVVTAVFLLVGFAVASDAQVVLTQAKLNAGLGGCDAPGYPLTICKPGSYKLGGNLGFVPGRNPNVWVVHITASVVTLDLNGFLVGGVCGPGVGIGIRANADTVGITVMNGSVTCMGSGIFLEGRQSRVDRITATLNNMTGIALGTYGILRDSTVTHNGEGGIRCELGCVITGNTVAEHPFTGIFANAGSTVIGNSVHRNSTGLFIAGNSGYSQNVFAENDADVAGGGTSMGHNVCSGAPC